MTKFDKDTIAELADLVEEIVLSDDKIYSKAQDSVKIQTVQGSYVVDEVTIEGETDIDFSKLI